MDQPQLIVDMNAILLLYLSLGLQGLIKTISYAITESHHRISRRLYNCEIVRVSTEFKKKSIIIDPFKILNCALKYKSSGDCHFQTTLGTLQNPIFVFNFTWMDRQWC